MNSLRKKSIITFVLCLGLIVNFNASEIANNELVNINDDVETNAATDLVTFNDPILEESLSATLGVPVGEITVADMETLTVYNGMMKGITDLTGLETATNLTDLNLMNNQISDVSPISGLTNLINLVLSDNQISDVSPLSSLINLDRLSLDENPISDISAISSLTNLTFLSLVEDPLLSDISPISTLTNLETLNIRRNPLLSDISPLSTLTNLTELELDENQISDISPLSTLTKLERLEIDRNQISDLSPLSGLTNLTFLDLSDNLISDVSPLSGLSNLEMVELHVNRISDLSPLADIADETHVVAMYQDIYLDDITVTTNDELIYYVTNIDGSQLPVSLGVPFKGTFKRRGPFDSDVSIYDGVIHQKVTYYGPLTGEVTATTTEETALSDEELISLFSVVNNSSESITVDQSAVDYKTPGDYPVIFTDESSDTLDTTLTITDVLPTLDVNEAEATIEVGSNLDDVLAMFSYSATEITEGDLTTSVVIDDTGVDYNTAGTYTLVLTVTDEEGNSVTKNVTVNVEEDSTEPEVVDPTEPEVVDPTEPEVVDPEVVDPEVDEIDEDDNSTSKSANDEQASDADQSDADEEGMSLAQTGGTIAITLIVLSVALLGLTAIRVSRR